MRFHLRLQVLPFLAIFLLAFGCGDTTGPQETPGSLNFTYSGATSGSFQAKGDLERDAQGNFTFGNWAAGIRENSDLAVVALQPRTAPGGDYFVIFLTNVTSPGTYALDASGCGDDQELSGLNAGAGNVHIDSGLRERIEMLREQPLQVGSSQCRTAVLFPNFDSRHFQDDPQAASPEELIVLLQGSVNVQSIDDQRIRGTFQGSGLRVVGAFVDPSQTVTVTGGTFDVPVVRDLE